MAYKTAPALRVTFALAPQATVFPVTYSVVRMPQYGCLSGVLYREQEPA